MDKMAEKDQMFREARPHMVQEMPAASRVTIRDQAIDQEPMLVVGAGPIQGREIIAGDFASVESAIDELAMTWLASWKQQVFQRISEITVATGQVTDAKELTPEIYLEVMDSMPWTFNDDGTHKMRWYNVPESVMKRMQAEWTSQHEAKLKEITERKRAESLATRRTRKLS